MLKIICFGDSITYGKWDIERGGWVSRLRAYLDERDNIGDIQNAQIYNLGIPGETTRRLIHRIDNELDSRLGGGLDEQAVVLFQVGVNDANHANAFHGEQVPKQELVQNIDRLLECARKHAKKIAFLGLMPIFENALYQEFPSFKDKFLSADVHEYAELLKNHCKEKDYRYIHLYSLLTEKDFIDGIHPTAEGHEQILETVLHNLERWEFFNSN